MATISLQCNGLCIFSNTFKCFLQAENSMTGRAYIGEVLTQVQLKSVKKMSELFDIQVNTQKEKNFQAPASPRKSVR